MSGWDQLINQSGNQSINQSLERDLSDSIPLFRSNILKKLSSVPVRCIPRYPRSPTLGRETFLLGTSLRFLTGESPKHMQGPIGSDPGTRWKGELAVCQDLQQFTCLWVLLTEKIRVSVKYGVKASKERLVLSVTAAPGPDSGGKKTGFFSVASGRF